MSETIIDYDKAIAIAAREWVNRSRDADLERTESTYHLASIAHEKLCWMLDAETYGWNPDDFRSETEG